MPSVSLAVFILLCIHVSSLGLTWIIMYGTILDPIRNWLIKEKFFRDLLRCGQCTGFWAGVLHLVAVIWVFINYNALWPTTLQQALICFVLSTLPLQTSAVCYAVDHLIIGIVKGIGDMVYYKNKQLKQQDDQMKIYHQDGSINTATSSICPSNCQTAAITSTATARTNPAQINRNNPTHTTSTETVP